MEILPTDALIVVDVQNDFCDGGALAVPGAGAILGSVNDLIGAFSGRGTVVLTQDWHPAGHSSFASRHTGKSPFDTVELDYGPQTLWPDHCVLGSGGARFHSGLPVNMANMIIRKGSNPDIDSYSGFFENDRKTATGLAGYLRERGIGRVFVCGLALDYCVRFTAADAAKQGFATHVVTDASRAIGDTAATLEEFRAAGVAAISTTAVLGADAVTS